MSTLKLIIIFVLAAILLVCLQIYWHPDGIDFFLSEQDYLIVFEIRLPRLLMAFAAGMALAVCGFILQWLVQNPMADPYLLGTSGGASLGHVLMVLVGIQSYWLSFGISFTFASLASLLAFFIATRRNQLSLFRLLLGGLAISSFCVAVSSALLLLLEGDYAVRSYMIWNFGSLENARWWSSWVVLLTAILVSIYLLRNYATLLVFSLGVDRAQNLGVPILSLRKRLLVITSIVVAVVVTLAGPIGFVGLIVPHVLKQFISYTDRHFAWKLALAGGLFLAACDTVATLVFSNTFPVGLITSFIGIPLFVLLLSKKSLGSF
jgi:iron complex transport system permease protein